MNRLETNQKEREKIEVTLNIYYTPRYRYSYLDISLGPVGSKPTQDNNNKTDTVTSSRSFSSEKEFKQMRKKMKRNDFAKSRIFEMSSFKVGSSLSYEKTSIP
jgi:hypothetical protein